MLRANASISQRHPWETVWWEWIFNLRGLLYYSNDRGMSYTQGMYLLGNPAIVWPAAANLVFVAVLGLVYLRCRGAPGSMWRGMGPFFARATYCMVAYFWNIFPYVFVKRSCYLYHYMPALLYAELLLAMTVDKLAGASALSISHPRSRSGRSRSYYLRSPLTQCPT